MVRKVLTILFLCVVVSKDEKGELLAKIDQGNHWDSVNLFVEHSKIKYILWFDYQSNTLHWISELKLSSFRFKI